MKEINIDLLIIGGGSAGMAAAIQAKKEGIDDILIVEKDPYIGGVLNQCIHSGFGLTEFKEELSGPEYADRFYQEILKLGISIKFKSSVVNLDANNKEATIVSNEDGIYKIHAKAIINATGCYERSGAMIDLPGDRCAGILTAGLAQKYANVAGYLCGKKVVILGSGDIGLIMARRFTLEGAKVICVAEIMPYSNGLNRNIQQCLIDYDIPLYLSTSVAKVIGKNRVEKVILQQVDDKFNFIPGTEKEIECDCLILSVGLTPYNALLENNNIPVAPSKGPLVNEHLETKIDGIFCCGNSLHVHDVVDFVSEESRYAGHSAALYIKGNLPRGNEIPVTPGNGVGYVVPNFISELNKESITLKLRVRKPVKDVYVIVESNNVIIKKEFKLALIPSEMLMINIPETSLKDISSNLTVRLEEKR